MWFFCVTLGKFLGCLFSVSAPVFGTSPPPGSTSSFAHCVRFPTQKESFFKHRMHMPTPPRQFSSLFKVPVAYDPQSDTRHCGLAKNIDSVHVHANSFWRRPPHGSMSQEAVSCPKTHRRIYPGFLSAKQLEKRDGEALLFWVWCPCLAQMYIPVECGKPCSWLHSLLWTNQVCSRSG